MTSFRDTPGSEPGMSLTAYLESVAAHLGGMQGAWVRCELLAIRDSGRWVRWEFTESKDGRLLARAAGGCSPAVHARVTQAFTTAGMTIQTGQEILVHVRPRLSPAYGFDFQVLDVDVRFSRGNLAVQADAIRNDLRRAGAWSLNRGLDQPADYVRVAVIAPPDSAGGGDFRSVVAGLERRGLTAFTFLDQAFQGPSAAAGIAMRLHALDRDCRAGEFDAVVLVRGGGSSADLTHLMDHALVEAVCRMSVPVIVGIGHDRDTTLLDEVACVSCATPTRAAELIRQAVVAAALEAGRARTEVRARGEAALTCLESGCAAGMITVAGHASQRLREAAAAVTAASVDLRPGVARSLAQARRGLSGVAGCMARDARSVDRAAAAAVAALSHAVSAGLRGAVHQARAGAAALVPKDLASLLREAGRCVGYAHAATKAGAASALRIVAAEVLSSRSEVRVAQVDIPGRAAAGVATAAAAAAAYTLQTLHAARSTVDAAGAAARMLDPAAVLARGYALVRGSGHRLVTGASELKAVPGNVRVEFRDGYADMRVITTGRMKT